MNKDIIYIDVEDDVTSVIGKVRAANEKIVALVPPKNIGSLQSAVNLRLLQKAADNAGKRIVLITNNSGLTALAAGIKMPVAKNLQSKPEIPVAPDKDESNEEDVIRGEDLPVGELAAATANPVAMAEPAVEKVAPVSAASLAPKPNEDDFTISELPDLDKETPVAASAKRGDKKLPHGAVSKVPNFGRFRKVFFIGGGLLVAIIAFFVLTNIFWTSANIVITAQTSESDVDLPLTLSADGTSNPDQGTIKVESKTLKKTASVDFTPTGKKNAGVKATGTVKFSTNNADVVLSGTTIPAGTELTASNGSVFLTNSSVTFTAANYKNLQVDVTAQDPGTTNNAATGSVDGAPDNVTAMLTGATSGGTDKNVTVVTSDDISTATSKLSASNATDAKSELTGQFGSDYVVIGDSFTSQDGAATATPAVGAEGTAGKVSRDSTYTIVAIKKDQIKILTTNALSSQVTGDNQKIYDDGSSTATVTQFVTSPSGVMTAHVKATGKIGPNIDENALKTQLVGKKSGEIIGQISTTSGVKNVTVSFAPFWRTTAPSADKIKISFDLTNGN